MNWNITSTATVLGDPSPNGEGFSILAKAVKLTPNMSGEIVKSQLIFDIAYAGNRAADLAPKMVKNTRIAFEGSFYGNQYGGPIIRDNEDGTPYTMFFIHASDIRIIGHAPKKPVEGQVDEDITTVLLVGNLGREPEMRFTPDGTAVTQSSIAVNRVYGPRDSRTTETVWFRINIWREGAEIANNLWHKGTKLLVKLLLRADETGAPQIYMRNTDGLPAAQYEGTVVGWEFAASKKDGGSAPLPSEERSIESDDEGIPF